MKIEQTGGACIMYRLADEPHGTVWVRPAKPIDGVDAFFSEVEVDGRIVPRFRAIEAPADPPERKEPEGGTEVSE